MSTAFMISRGWSPTRRLRRELTCETPAPSGDFVHTYKLTRGTSYPSELNVTEEDLVEAKGIADRMSLEEVRALMGNVLKQHDNDPNFPFIILEKVRDFLGKSRHISFRPICTGNNPFQITANEDVIENPEKHEDLIYEMKLEAALITNNSPYSEVRAVVDNHDDPSTPCSTIRSWVIGLGFSILLGFINQLFSIRQPTIMVLANVAQLLSFPIGKAWEKTLPDVGFTLFGVRHSLNPGPFNKKEHMLITIMANVAYQTPYTNVRFQFGVLQPRLALYCD